MLSVNFQTFLMCKTYHSTSIVYLDIFYGGDNNIRGNILYDSSLSNLGKDLKREYINKPAQ